MVLRRKITIKIIGGIQSRESQTNYNYQREREGEIPACLSKSGMESQHLREGQDNWDILNAQNR